jgi:hypothetical protein
MSAEEEEKDRSIDAAFLPRSPLCHFERKSSAVLGWMEEPWRPREVHLLSSSPSLSTLKSCLKSCVGSSHRVRFSNVIFAAEPNSLAPQNSADDGVTRNHARSTDLAVSLMRDKTMLRTESAAWSYAWAYDAAYQQFGSCGGAVDSILQRALLHGIHKGYLTLERFSEDSRGRREQAQQTRRSILDEFHKLKDSDAKDCSEQLTEHCRQVSRVHKQWALYMGRLQFATSKTEAVVPPSPPPLPRRSTPVEVVEKVTLQSKAQRWKIKLPSPRRGAIVLVA